MATQTFANDPDFVANWGTYQAIADFEDGSKERVLKYLIPHRSETDGTAEGIAAFRDRQRRLYHVNGCDIYLTVHCAHMAQPIEIPDTDNGPLALIKQDVTGYGLTHEEAAGERRRLRLRDGRVGCLVDRTKEKSPNVEQAIRNGERSYQVNYCATRIRKAVRFKSGPMKGKLREVVLEDDPVEQDGKCFESFRRYWIEKPGQLFRYQILRGLKRKHEEPIIDGKERAYLIVDAGPGSLDYIPFELWGDGPKDSFLSDIWQLDGAIMNLNNVRSSINFHHGFPRNIMTGVKREEISKMAEWTITLLKDTEARLFTIPAGDPAAVEREIAELKRERTQRGLIRINQLAEDTRQVQSAESKAFDLLQQQSFYMETLNQQERMESNIWATIFQMETNQRTTVKVTIGRDFHLDDPDAVEKELKAFEALATKMRLKRGLAEVAKVRISKIRWVPTKKGDDVEKIKQALYDEADAADPFAVEPSTTGALAAAQAKTAQLFGTKRPVIPAKPGEQ